MLSVVCMLWPTSMSPSSAPQCPALCRRNMEEVLNKYLLMLCLCMYVLLPWWTVCFPRPEARPALCCSLSLFGIQYRPGFNNGRLISGPRTRIFAAGQEAFSLWFLGLSPQYSGYLWWAWFCAVSSCYLLQGGSLCVQRWCTTSLPFGTPGPPPPPLLLPPPTPCTMLLLCLLWLRIYHPGCIATSLVSFTSPPPTKLPEL